MQIRLHFTALVNTTLMPIDHANILYTDTVENPRERSIQGEGKEVNSLEKEMRKKMHRRTSHTPIFS